MLRVGQLECVSNDVVCGVSYCVDNEKVFINEDECQERKLHNLIVETRPRRFWNVFFALNLCTPLNYTSRKHGKKEPQSFVHCGSFDHLDL